MASLKDEIYIVIGQDQIELYDVDGEVRLINEEELGHFLMRPPAEVVMALVSDINDKNKVQVLTRQQLKGVKDQPGILEALERQYLLYSAPEGIVKGLPPLSEKFLPAALAVKIFLEHEGLLKDTVLAIEKVYREMRFIAFAGGVPRYCRTITLYEGDDLEQEAVNTYLYLRDSFFARDIDLVVSNLDFLDGFHPVPSLTARGLELRKGKLKHIATMESFKRRAQKKETPSKSPASRAAFVIAMYLAGALLGGMTGLAYRHRSLQQANLYQLEAKKQEVTRELSALTQAAGRKIEERLGSAIFSRKPDIGAVLRLVLSCFPGDARLVQLYYDDQRLSILGETDKASEIPAALLDISHKLPGNGGIVYERGKAYFSWEIPLEVK